MMEGDEEEMERVDYDLLVRALLGPEPNRTLAVRGSWGGRGAGGAGERIRDCWLPSVYSITTHRNRVG